MQKEEQEVTHEMEIDREEVFTTKGNMKVSELEVIRGQFEDEHEITKYVEYYHEGELVRRSVHVHLKKNVIADAFAAEF